MARGKERENFSQLRFASPLTCRARNTGQDIVAIFKPHGGETRGFCVVTRIRPQQIGRFFDSREKLQPAQVFILHRTVYIRGKAILSRVVEVCRFTINPKTLCKLDATFVLFARFHKYLTRANMG